MPLGSPESRIAARVTLDLRASGDKIALFTNTEGDQTIQTIATHYMVFRLPTEVPDTCLNEYCVACQVIPLRVDLGALQIMLLAHLRGWDAVQ